MMRRLSRLALVLASLLALFALVLPLAADDKGKAGGPQEECWVQLFNGKDLSGWKVYPEGTGEWKVEDGVLVGSGKTSHLFSEGEYDNFYYRVEAMINDGGNSGQYSRAQFGPGFPKGYEAQINATHKDPIRTGSLYPSFAKLSDDERKKILVLDQLHKPDQWFIQEVMADGNHIMIKVNGNVTVDFIDQNNTYSKGHFALQQHDPGTVVKFRKIEYRPITGEKK
jgi:hypothetical protein